MKINKIFTTIFLLIQLLSSCVISSNLKENRALLKEYAYCKCLQYALKDTVFLIKDLSISVYREIAHYYDDAYDIVDSLSKKSAANILPSIINDHNGEKSVFKDCFIYFKSKSLDSLVKSLDKRNYKDW